MQVIHGFVACYFAFVALYQIFVLIKLNPGSLPLFAYHTPSLIGMLFVWYSYGLNLDIADIGWLRNLVN